MTVGAVILIVFCCIVGLVVGVYVGMWLSRAVTPEDQNY